MSEKINIQPRLHFGPGPEDKQMLRIRSLILEKKKEKEKKTDAAGYAESAASSSRSFAVRIGCQPMPSSPAVSRGSRLSFTSNYPNPSPPSSMLGGCRIDACSISMYFRGGKIKLAVVHRSQSGAKLWIHDTVHPFHNYHQLPLSQRR